MSEQYLGSVPPDHATEDAMPVGPHGLDLGGHDSIGHDSGERPNGPGVLAEGAADQDITEARALVQMAREQLARDIADIERATAALRLAEPALQSWSKPTTQTAANPRPLWLLIGVLWLSTAIVTVGAAVAIAALAG
jgi:hypothetical protein